MTTLSVLSLLLGVGLLLLALRLEGEARARDALVATLSPLAVTRAASACLVTFGGVGMAMALALPASDRWAARVATFAGMGAAALAALLTARMAERGATVSDDLMVDDDGIVGMTGTFVAAASRRAAGRVLIRRGARTLELAARPAIGAIAPDRWDSVVVVDVFRGTALVAPVERDGAAD
ncbi:MAG: hypothetical protein ACT4PJ_05600 [Gemmatimonadaceae bacterium]